MKNKRFLEFLTPMQMQRLGCPVLCRSARTRPLRAPPAALMHCGSGGDGCDRAADRQSLDAGQASE